MITLRGRGRLLTAALFAAAFAAGLPALMIAPAVADSRLDLSYAWADNGSCSEATETLALTFTGETGLLEAYADVRQAPAGGDCREQGLAGTLELRVPWVVNPGAEVEWGALALFEAHRYSVHGTYALAGGELRADGRPAHPVVLPAGTVDAWDAVLGASAAWRGLTVELGAGLVPRDWADGEISHTAHLGLGAELPLLWGTVEVATAVDTDFRGHAFSAHRLVWRPETGWIGLSVGLHHERGLAQLANEAPPEAEFYGLRAVLVDGIALQDEATRIVVGATVRI